MRVVINKMKKPAEECSVVGAVTQGLAPHLYVAEEEAETPVRKRPLRGTGHRWTRPGDGGGAEQKQPLGLESPSSPAASLKKSELGAPGGLVG